MATYSPDTIRILVSTDNHVGYAEANGPRKNDSWRTFDEVLSLAKQHDVDMVLLGGDLFHDNHPSRKAMIEVTKSLREHCFGDKPCALEIVGDQSEHFPGLFNYANYMDENLNVSIPVFSIHGNHDDPTGIDHTAALDLLHATGLLNYFGHVAEVDKIEVKPILLQKGDTKLALYGLSNVRDERLFQTFRDHKVTFFNPTQSKREWYNILCVHQNHTPHTDSSYLPESSLPDNMDMIVWGHEHECKINPRPNLEMGFSVMQPGSTIATSLIPGEAVPKHVAILNITGKECKVETIRLRTVRPFVYRDIVLRDQKGMKQLAQKSDNLAEVKKFCKGIIEEMIKEAKQEWVDQNQEMLDDAEEQIDIPLPLIRLRVEYSPPDHGGEFKVEQNVRFSQEYQDRVANINDVIYFHKRRQAAGRRAEKADLPSAQIMQQLDAETVKVSDMVREFLNTQSLTMLPQNLFSDAVTQFVDKQDKKAIELFVDDSLKVQVDTLIIDGEDESEEETEEQILTAMETIKAQQEERFRKGEIRARKSMAGSLLPRPANWDSDEDGSWVDYPGALAGQAENDQDNDNSDVVGDDDGSVLPATRGRGRGRGTRARGRGGRTAASGTTRKTAATKKAPPAKSKAAQKRPPMAEDSDDDDDDIIMLDGDDEGLFVSQQSSARPSAPSAKSRTIAPSKAAAKQSTLSFGPSSTSTNRNSGRARHEPSDDEIDDDDDAFEPAVPASRATRRR